MKYGIRTQEQVDAINNQNKNTAKGLFKGMVSGEILPTFPNIGRMISSAYNGWLDPETTAQIGIAPTGTMKRIPTLSQMPERFRKLELERASAEAAKNFEKIFQNTPKYKIWRGEKNVEVQELTLPDGKKVLVTQK